LCDPHHDDVQARESLRSGAWANLVTNIAGTAGMATKVDTTAANLPQRFYRLCLRSDGHAPFLPNPHQRVQAGCPYWNKGATGKGIKIRLARAVGSSVSSAQMT
jgi:hypothetical protein